MIFNESDGAVTYNAFKFGQYDNTWTNNSYIRCYEGIRQASILINNVDINEELSAEEIADCEEELQEESTGPLFKKLFLLVVIKKIRTSSSNS